MPAAGWVLLGYLQGRYFFCCYLYFIHEISEIRKVEADGQEIGGLWSARSLGLHGALGGRRAMWCNGRRSDQKPWSHPEPSLPYCYHLEARHRPLSSLGSNSSLPALPALPALNKAARESVPLGPGALRTVTKERLTQVPSAQKPTRYSLACRGATGTQQEPDIALPSE